MLEILTKLRVKKLINMNHTNEIKLFTKAYILTM